MELELVCIFVFLRQIYIIDHLIRIFFHKTNIRIYVVTQEYFYVDLPLVGGIICS